MTKPGDPTLPSAPDHGATVELHADEAYCSACNQSYPSETKTCPNDGARLIRLAAQKDSLIGKVLDERYEIRAPLGKGGMGTVYRGWQLSVDREVAIKVIHPKLSDDRSAVKRFLREARLASRLSQPNIVNVYDFGQSDGVLYLVMELLRGHTLSTELGQGRRINPKRTVVMASQLCDALEAAHAQGIVHRDLKPGNIVILDDPPGRDLIKVLDFGLAKSLVQDSGSIVTNTDALLGTPLYMSPEQIEGKDSDQRADLYSLGCILYEMLSGKPPFVDNAVSAVLARHVGDTPAALPAHVPSKLRALVEALLAKKPEERIQSAGEVRRILDDIRESPMLPTPQPFESVAGPADTIPDVDDALAETHDATPVPPSSVAASSPPLGTSTASAERVFTAVAGTQSIEDGKPSSARRWGVIAVFMLVPLAVLLVVFKSQAPKSAPDGDAGGLRNAGSQADHRFVVDDRPMHDAGATMGIVNTPVTADAAVPIDARVAATPVDAGVKKSSRTSTRPKDTGTTAPVVRIDAGVELPDLDFVKKKK